MKSPDCFFLILISFILGIFLADSHCSLSVVLNGVFLLGLVLVFLKTQNIGLTISNRTSLVLFFCLILILIGFFYYYFFKSHLIFQTFPKLKFLVKFKNFYLSTFKKFFPQEESSFLSSILFRERNSLTPDFKKLLMNSGTYHLTSFSGVHLTTIVFLSSGIFFFLPISLSFVLKFLLIIFFVLLIGAHPSILRAAIMGLAYLISQSLSYKTKPRNVIAFTACLILLFNPSFISDLGFQLSFLSILGIIYLKPMLAVLFPRFKLDNFLTTASAILLTTPLIAFKNMHPPFIFSAILANLLVLEFIPLTILLSFILGFFSFLSYYLALTLSWFIFILLKYEIFIIRFFGRFCSNFTFSSNFLIIWLYYLILFIIFFAANEKRRMEKRHC